MLVLDQLSKAFYDPGRGPVQALAGVTATLAPGVVALMGANGAGKSTLLRCLAGLMRPDGGAIHLDGVDVLTRPQELRRRLGYLAAGTRLYPRLSAREMLAYAGGFAGLHGAALASRIGAMCEAFALDEFLDSRCEALSTGQAQRVNLARTLLADPDLLILDEPTTGLDLVAARQVIDTVRASIRPGRLIIIATHVVAEAEALAERLLVLRQGRLVHDGPPSALGSAAALAEAVLGLVRGTMAGNGGAPQQVTALPDPYPLADPLPQPQGPGAAAT